MQAEAGQSLEQIVARKEVERKAGRGVFCWGVGNAPARALVGLADLKSPIDLIFSVMRTAPRAIDREPDQIVVWRGWSDGGGVSALPAHVLVTSRASGKSPPRAHYALFAKSTEPLMILDLGPLDHRELRNVSDRGGCIGRSQVTALVRRDSSSKAMAPAYRIDMRARLTAPYWVRLADPRILTPPERARLFDHLQGAANLNTAEWLRLSAAARSGGL